MKNFFKSPRDLTFLGLMLAITIILDLTPLGAVPLGAISATITHIPAIITGIVLGPIAGLIMGTSLGIISLIHALTRPMTILDPLFMNPLISVLPRMFIGVISYYVYRAINMLFKKQSLKNTVSTFIGGMAGSLTNTALVFLMLYLIYAKEVVEGLGASFGVIIFTVFTTNAIAEALISGIITMPVAAAYFRYNKTRNM
ncbi:MAG: ECF transporter S component [Acetivibrionales bacterium]|jgi:uncharacterized membrane protein|nr:ECF transporter S component [Clostridiaceae bacterium]